MRNQSKLKPSTSYVEQGDLLRTRNLVSDSLDTLRSLANLAAGVSGNTGVPGLSLGLSMLITILDKIQVSSYSERQSVLTKLQFPDHANDC